MIVLPVDLLRDSLGVSSKPRVSQRFGGPPTGMVMELVHVPATCDTLDECHTGFPKIT